MELLRDAGAIPFVRSNVPQALMLPETDNNVWGRTSNPWDVSRSVGGSSGGEGGLIAFGASPLGIGTDIGGSIRNPAHVCGIVGLKPTPHRISHQGVYCVTGSWCLYCSGYNGMQEFRFLVWRARMGKS